MVTIKQLFRQPPSKGTASQCRALYQGGGHSSQGSRRSGKKYFSKDKQSKKDKQKSGQHDQGNCWNRKDKKGKEGSGGAGGGAGDGDMGGKSK